MSRRSKIKTQIPEAIRDEFNAELVAGGFSDYQGLTDWLNTRLKAEGIDVTVSIMAANRYGSEFQKQFEADMSEARQIHELAKMSAKDESDDGAVRDVITRILQTRVVSLLSALRGAEKTGDPESIHKVIDSINKLSRSAADLNRTDILSQKYKAQIRKEANEEAAKKVSVIAKAEGVSEATIERIRRDVLGMAG